MRAVPSGPMGIRGAGGYRRAVRSLALLCAIPALLGVVACSGGVNRSTAVSHDNARDRVADARLSQLAAFRDVPWADDLKAEQDRFSSMGKPPSKYGDWSIPDFNGRYTNTKDGERRTFHAPCDGCPKRTIWFSGNSAAFGYGQRDDFTIASDLSRLGAAAGFDLTVRNLGVPGTAFYDEIPWIDAHLRIDSEMPDLVVFYDGFNDALQAYMYAVLTNGGLLDPVSYKNDFAAKYQAMVPPPDLKSSLVAKVAQHVADEYRSTQSLARAVLGARGIASEYFFQPDSFVSRLQSEGLARSMNVNMADLVQKSNFARLLRRTAEDLNGDVHDLRPVFAGYDRPVFADPAHMNEDGAKHVAEAMFAVIRHQLR